MKIFQCVVLVTFLACFWAAPTWASEAEAALLEEPMSYHIPEQLSPKEREWFKVFQEGNMLVAGWQKISSEILAKTPPDQREAQQIVLEKLGTKIGMEWCRDNKVRKVNTSMLQDWGGILRKVAKENPKNLSHTLASIDEEVDSVLD